MALCFSFIFSVDTFSTSLLIRKSLNLKALFRLFSMIYDVVFARISYSCYCTSTAYPNHACLSNWKQLRPAGQSGREILHTHGMLSNDNVQWPTLLLWRDCTVAGSANYVARCLTGLQATARSTEWPAKIMVCIAAIKKFSTRKNCCT